ncbi:alpha/beta fold hydrolase [Roseibium sp. RKSG952]|uniref:alpha/beta fold hydrolase n=1 Tax=Roseibium sp. RKSG952 TaxID=2529384 RepID=UPI0012BC46D9|nr:alpha/beta hydrolase [Roseibium sp. RKSG952]MTI00117.1 alpha/beta hydrolase [Roseibium sp. RKSG952]
MSLVHHPDNPVPPGATSGLVKTPDGVSLRFAHWPALGGRRKGTVTLLQGRAEFIEKYFEMVSDLRARGFAVVAFDWRGQGGSDRLLKNRWKGHVPDFAKYREDLRTILRDVSLAEYAGPHYALAHSTGGAVLLSDTQRLRTLLDRAVICAPLTGLPDFGIVVGLHRSARMVVKWISLGLLGRARTPEGLDSALTVSERLAFFMARCLYWAGLGRFFVPGGNSNVLVPYDENKQTSDPVRFRRFNGVLEAHPELGIGAPTIGWLHAAAKTIRSFKARQFGPSVVLPCLVITAGHDRIVSTSATEELCSRTKNAGYLEIAGSEHEILMEQDRFREQFFAAFDAFIPGVEMEAELKASGGSQGG